MKIDGAILDSTALLPNLALEIQTKGKYSPQAVIDIGDDLCGVTHNFCQYCP
ncbi:MAG: hypothetical protein WAQ27_02935 [Candidatus Microsaccharimonas sp.]